MAGSPGPGVDKSGNAVLDPTANVKALNEAGLQRQDDLRNMQADHVRQMLDLRAIERDTAIKHINELAQLRAEMEEKVASLRASHSAELAAKETQRLDAIRAVDRDAVTRAAEVSATQAATLAATQATSAETLRTQVEATRAANATTLAQALAPITESIELLRAAQYAQQGERSAVGSTTDQLEPILKEIAQLRADQYTQFGARGQAATGRQQQNWSTSTTLLIVGIMISLLVGVGGVIAGTGALTAPSKDVTVLPNCASAPAGTACTTVK